MQVFVMFTGQGHKTLDCMKQSLS